MAPATNLIVFRDVSEKVSGRSLARRLRQALGSTSDHRECLVSALIIAGQIECAISDGAGDSRIEAEALTDLLAGSCIQLHPPDPTQLLPLLARVEGALPDELRLSEPEGFAYYVLHPCDFADAVTSLPECQSIAVIGIRSIGTTLSAVTRAALLRLGISATRITVRPTGHPYDRKTSFADEQLSWVEGENRKGSNFIIADEGPGLSGSSFLSVAEALEARGVDAGRIRLIGSHNVNPRALCATDAARRWERYTWQRVDSRIAHSYASHIPLSGGLWRNLFLSSESAWPACWPEMEGIKFLSGDRKHFSKFEGLGHHGERARERASALFDAGFSPPFTDAGQGMSQYEFVIGPLLAASNVSKEILDQIARYCAYRASEFGAKQQLEPLEEMVGHNLAQVFGRMLELPSGIYASRAPVIVDARMQPHKWVMSKTGKLLKVDGAADGEGHFLPGPTDIAWDLAGAIVEWNLSRDAEEYLVAEFHKQGGRSSEPQLSFFVLAYTLFRVSFSQMALNSTGNQAEKARLERAVLFYRTKVGEALKRPDLTHSEVLRS
ncbi:MAG TPA: hypothetical protein VMU05_19330 [Dongiaceae bacterium]|nr:hypothetical protein [Dongiaceae bacterium]